MQVKDLQLKRALRSVLLFLLLSAAGMGKMYAQTNLIVNPDFENTSGFDYSTISEYTRVWSGGVQEGQFIHDVTSNGHGVGAVGWPNNLTGYGGSGYYLLFNGFGGSQNPTKAAWKQTIPVTPNTNYTFSAQVRNLAQGYMGLNPNPAILRLIINDQQVGSDITLPQHNNWFEWGEGGTLTWNSGSATQANIRIVDAYMGQSSMGDDFGIDHLSFVAETVYSVTANPDNVSVCLNVPENVYVLNNDIIQPNNIQEVTLGMVTDPQFGVCFVNNTNHYIQYIYMGGGTGTDQFKYRATYHGVTSEAWVFVTTANPPVVGNITAQGPICAGGVLNISVPTVNPSATGHWEYGASQTGTFQNLDPNNIPLSMNGKWVRYSATNDCGTGTSNAVQITVTNGPSWASGSAGQTPQIQPICAGQSLSLTPPTYNNNGSQILSYGWVASPTENGEYTTFSLNNISASYNGWYIRYMVEGSCGYIFSTPARQLTVYQNDNNITFADANVKAICVANWDTNGDGELSYDEAAVVTDLGQVFRGNTAITSFEELQYFTGLTVINSYTFYGCSCLSSVVIPNSVTTIAQYAFVSCGGLISIVIPNSVTSIGTYAFGYCPNLASITIPNSVVYIGEGAFCYCSSLVSIAIPNSVTFMGTNPFVSCSGLEQITVDSGNTVYDSRNNCNAVIKTSTNELVSGCKSTEIPDSVISIGINAFYYCANLTSIFIPNSVVSIGGSAFSHTGLTSIVIPASVSSLENAFLACHDLEQIMVESGNLVYDSRENCNAIINTNSNELVLGCKNTVIPNSVTSIRGWAFEDCIGMSSINIPNAVTFIGDYAFHNCIGLSSITVLAETPPTLDYEVFEGVDTTIPVYVPCSSINAYQSAGGWNEFTNYLPATECDSGVISVTVNPTEGGIVTGTGYYEGGTICTLTAVPNEGYVFMNWIKNGELVGTGSSYSFIVNGDEDFVANFAEEGDVCAITFNLYDSYGDGYTGNYLVVTDENGISQQLTVESGSSAVYTLQFLTGSHIALTWIVGSWPEDCSFTVTYSNGNVIYYGENLNNNFNYEFDVDCDGLFDVMAEANPTDGGTITGTGQYEFNETCTLIAIANEGYTFINWTENGAIISNNAEFSFTVSENRNLVANFMEGDLCAITFNLFDSYGDGYTGNCLVINFPDGSSQQLTVESGSSASHTLWIAHGSHITLTWIVGSWPEDCSFTVSYSNGNVIYYGENLSSSFSYEFDVDCVGMPAITFDVMAEANPTDGGTITGTGQYEFNETCTLIAIANEGYTFINWTENGANISNNAEFSFTVSENRNLVANFVEGDLCTITFNLFDSYGDGYTGNYLVVTDENGVSQQLTIGYGSSAVYTLPFLTNSHIALTWIVGSYPEDCSFMVSYSNGNVIYYGKNLSSSFSYEFDVDCVGMPAITFDVMAEANPTDGGTITGTGQYEYNETCALSATANEGYIFVNWTQDGAIVSNDAEYSFYVVDNVVIVAHFVPLGNIAFADASVKSICVANWDTNGDGELSYYEAAVVTDLGQVFRDNTAITSFEELQYFTGLTTISSYAFYNCSNLSGSLYIPNSVITIGGSAFDGCSGFTGGLTIPNSVTTIGFRAFYDCSGFTGSLTIPNSVTTIGSVSFGGCRGFSGSLFIPNSVIEIEYNPFTGCSGIEQIMVEINNPNYDSRDNCNAIIETSSNTLVSGCKNSIILDGLTSIGSNAFCGCSGLTGSLIIPNSVTTIGDGAFQDCNGLTGDLTLPNFLTSIGHNAFYRCSGFTGSLTIPNSVTTIGIQAFRFCNGFTGSLTIGNSVTMIGNSAFNYCYDFESIIVDSGNTFYDSRENCNALIETGTDNLILGCKNSIVPNSVITIGDYAFERCSGLTGELVIPNSVTTIGDGAFERCSGLTGSLTIPNSVTSIGSQAFYGCSGLTEAMVLGTTPPSLGYYTFYNTTFPIYVPYESLNTYKTANLWSNYANRIYPMAYKTVPGYGEEEDNWRFIASPLVENIVPTTVNNMITETPYDLYQFNQSATDEEWQNYKANNFNLTNGQGYLYANAEETNIIFKGNFNEDETKEVELAYNANANLAGWNLVGNPFPVSAYANRSYYVMNEEGTAIEPVAVSMETAIPACTGVMVKAENVGETVTFSKTAPRGQENQGVLQIAVAQADTRCAAMMDKAIVSFNAGDKLEKFVFNRDNAQLYIPRGTNNYAIISAEKTCEMPLNFEAKKNGSYTLTMDAEMVDMDYLHLIDNLTGDDVDLLVEPSYTFEAKTTDYASRFRLVFSTSDAGGDACVPGFAFINGNGNISILGIEGEATLQVMDVSGHVLSSETFSGSYEKKLNVVPGVYMLRLINGDDVKVQKIVVR